MNGIIILNKPSDCSSHKMVSVVRRALNIKRVGHTGTLDPDAQGVLPMLIGTATRAADMLTAQDKKYTAIIRLGITTDTLDKSGNILEEKEVNVSIEDIKKVLLNFIGDIEQVPPMYSAIQINGVRLYNLARQGIEIERQKRKVTIYSIDIKNFESPFLTIDVHCSKGTYIRTLAEDIGKALGCGAHIDTLIRTQSGIFDIKDAVTPEKLIELSEKNMVDTILIPTDFCFKEYDKIKLNEKQSERVKNGVPIYYKGKTVGETFRLYDQSGTFIALSIVDMIGERTCLKLVKGFY